MDASSFRKRVIIKALASPVVLVPAGLGAASAAMAAIGPGGDAVVITFLSIMGVTGLIAGAGAALSRLIYGVDRIGKEVMEEELGQSDAARGRTEGDRKERLTELRRRAEVQGDHSVATSAFRLTGLAGRLAQAGKWHGSASTAEAAAGTTAKAEELFDSCVESAERALGLLVAARQMSTEEGRQRVASARESLLVEIDAGIERVGLALDRLQAAALTRDASGVGLTRVRDELDAGLSVAQRVEERMSDLEQTFGGAHPDLDAPTR